MKKADQTILEFKKGYNCSQAILSIFGPLFNLEREECYRIAELFGGGIGYSGNICGALTGSLMVLGLKFGRQEADDIKSKKEANYFATNLFNEFKAHNGSILCRELIQYDIINYDGLEKARKQKVFENCPKYIKDSTEILEKLLNLPQ